MLACRRKKPLQRTLHERFAEKKAGVYIARDKRIYSGVAEREALHSMSYSCAEPES